MSFSGFAGMVSAAAVWAIWGSDMFPEEADPTGSMLIIHPGIFDMKLTCFDNKIRRTGRSTS